MKHRGFLLVESLFSISLFITCVIVLMSMYAVLMKENTKINNDYKYYIIDQSKKEKDVWISVE